MNRFRSATAALALALAAGCGGGPEMPPPVDPANAGRELSAALESWKNNEPSESLATKQPPVIFNEPLREAGTRLVAYELGPVELQGRQGRCTAKLTLKSSDGKQYERSIGYVIDIASRVVITRESLGP